MKQFILMGKQHHRIVSIVFIISSKLFSENSINSIIPESDHNLDNDQMIISAKSQHSKYKHSLT
jgi:hypothetical protein